MNDKNPIDTLIDQAGGDGAVAAALGISRQAVNAWRTQQRVSRPALIAVLQLAGVRWSSPLAAQAGAANCPKTRRALTPEAWVELLRRHGGVAKARQHYLDELFPPGTVAAKTAPAVAALLGADCFL